MERDVKRGERREGKSDSSRDGVMTRLDNDDDEGNDHGSDEERCWAMDEDASCRRHGDLSSGWATVQGRNDHRCVPWAPSLHSIIYMDKCSTLLCEHLSSLNAGSVA